MLSIEELRELSLPSSSKTLRAIVLDWFFIALLFGLAVRFPHPVTYVFCFILMARQQLALAILMHDGAHGRLFFSPFWNNYVGQYLTASPLVISMRTYRNLHLKHHQNPLAPDDPDINLIGGYPINPQSLKRKLLRDLFGMTYFKFLAYFLMMSRTNKESREKTLKKMEVPEAVRGPKISTFHFIFSVIFVQTLLFSVLFFFQAPWLYFFLWALPMMTLLQLLLRIRGITEHAGYTPNRDQRYNTRTLINPFQTFFFAPHSVNYHIEHHLYPSVPYANLHKVHALLKERGSLPEANIFYSYRDVLDQLVVSPCDKVT